MTKEPLAQTPPPLRLDAEADEHDEALSAFARVRPPLFGIPYRVLGSATEVVVQDVWLPWQLTNRLSINLAQSAHNSNFQRSPSRVRLFRAVGHGVRCE